MRPSIWLSLIGFAFVVGYLAGRHDAQAGDYTVTRGTTITSERPIWLLVVEMGMGVLNANSNAGRIGTLVANEEIPFSSRLRIDGRPALAAERNPDTGAPGGWADRDRTVGSARVHTTALTVDGQEQRGPTSFLAAWRLLGFILWDADGSISRTTTATIRGHAVRITDVVSNGRVVATCVIGPPLGDPRVRQAVLELEATEDDTLRRDGSVESLATRATVIRLDCSAKIRLPGDRCGLVRRISVRIAERDGGAELSDRVRGLERAGRRAALAGRAEIDAVIDEFIRRCCRD